MKREPRTIRLPGGAIVENKYEHWRQGAEPSGDGERGNGDGGSGGGGQAMSKGQIGKLKVGDHLHHNRYSATTVVSPRDSRGIITIKTKNPDPLGDGSGNVIRTRPLRGEFLEHR